MLGIVSETVALAVGSSPQSLHGGLVVLSDAYLSADAADGLLLPVWFGWVGWRLFRLSGSLRITTAARW